MNKNDLPIAWSRWRRRRYKRLVAQGLTNELAWAVANGEAEGRHRISGIVGEHAARDAELEFVEAGGTIKFVLVGDMSDLSEAQKTAVTRLGMQQASTT